MMTSKRPKPALFWSSLFSRLPHSRCVLCNEWNWLLEWLCSWFSKVTGEGFYPLITQAYLVISFYKTPPLLSAILLLVEQSHARSSRSVGAARRSLDEERSRFTAQAAAFSELCDQQSASNRFLDLARQHDASVRVKGCYLFCSESSQVSMYIIHA